MDERLKQILSEILEIDESQINDDFGPGDTPSWDSMNNLRLVTAIEEEFQIQLTMSDIKKMSSYAKISEVIATYIRLKKTLVAGVG